MAAQFAGFIASKTGKFQHTATRRWLRTNRFTCCTSKCFNTQPPEGGCSYTVQLVLQQILFQHTATRRWLRAFGLSSQAIFKKFQHTATRRWLQIEKTPLLRSLKFQHTATRRGLLMYGEDLSSIKPVSTHSHPKVAAFNFFT